MSRAQSRLEKQKSRLFLVFLCYIAYCSTMLALGTNRIDRELSSVLKYSSTEVLLKSMPYYVKTVIQSCNANRCG